LANCVITADWPLRVDLGHLADDISSQANFGLWLYSDSESGQRGGPFTSQLQTLRWECRLFQGLGLLYRRGP
jgi:hypothetical protein